MGTPYKPAPKEGSLYPFPSYDDLGKDCRDLFDKGYNLEKFVINVKNKTCHGVEITTKGVHKNEDKTATGEVCAKVTSFPFPILQGFSTQHKWDTENNFKNEVTLQDVYVPGLKLTTEVVLNEEKMEATGAVKVQHKHAFYTLDGAFDNTGQGGKGGGDGGEGGEEGGEGGGGGGGGGGGDAKQLIKGSLVTGWAGLMGAYKIEYDTGSGEISGQNMGFAYHKKDYDFHLAYKNGEKSTWEGFFHHKISRELQVGAKAKYGDETEYGIAGRYMFSGYGHALRAKVNNKSLLGVGLECTVVPGFQVFAAGEADLTKFSEGGHKIGFGMEFGMME